ncbi:MAG: SH3 domain-containing protein [Spirochaetes bacterium]|nr:MAG: SH3 domain-containing protein [Spirochaetota bacterium]
MASNHAQTSRAALMALAMLVCIPSCRGKSGTQPAAGEQVLQYGIVISDDANLRIDPLLYSTRIALLNKGDRVEIIEQTKDKSTAGKLSDYWYKVKMGKGITGWLFGGNIKTFKLAQAESIDSYVTAIYKDEEKKYRKVLSGKWWSVDIRDDYTNHALELYEDGKYKSYLRGQKEIEGDYSFNYMENELLFSEGTSFGKNVKYSKKGTVYRLETKVDGWNLRFKKIVDDIEAEKAEKDKEKEKEKKAGKEAAKAPVDSGKQPDKNQ